MDQETLLPSEISRLVYGFLLQENCPKTANAFLEESPIMTECRNFVSNGKQFSTRVCNFTLVDILDKFCSTSSAVLKKLHDLESKGDVNVDSDFLYQIKSIMGEKDTSIKNRRKNNLASNKLPTSNILRGISRKTQDCFIRNRSGFIIAGREAELEDAVLKHLPHTDSHCCRNIKVDNKTFQNEIKLSNEKNTLISQWPQISTKQIENVTGTIRDFQKIESYENHERKPSSVQNNEFEPKGSEINLNEAATHSNHTTTSTPVKNDSLNISKMLNAHMENYINKIDEFSPSEKNESSSAILQNPSSNIPEILNQVIFEEKLGTTFEDVPDVPHNNINQDSNSTEINRQNSQKRIHIPSPEKIDPLLDFEFFSNMNTNDTYSHYLKDSFNEFYNIDSIILQGLEPIQTIKESSNKNKKDLSSSLNNSSLQVHSPLKNGKNGKDVQHFTINHKINSVKKHFKQLNSCEMKIETPERSEQHHVRTLDFNTSKINSHSQQEFSTGQNNNQSESKSHITNGIEHDKEKKKSKKQILKEKVLRKTSKYDFSSNKNCNKLQSWDSGLRKLIQISDETKNEKAIKNKKNKSKKEESISLINDEYKKKQNCNLSSKNKQNLESKVTEVTLNFIDRNDCKDKLNDGYLYDYTIHRNINKDQINNQTLQNKEELRSDMHRKEQDRLDSRKCASSSFLNCGTKHTESSLTSDLKQHGVNRKKDNISNIDSSFLYSTSSCSTDSCYVSEYESLNPQQKINLTINNENGEVDNITARSRWDESSIMNEPKKRKGPSLQRSNNSCAKLSKYS